MINFFSFNILYLLFVQNVVLAQFNNDCSKVDEVKRECIIIKQCPPLLELVTNQKNNATAVEYLRSLTCGFQGFDPKVCCVLNLNLSTENGNVQLNESLGQDNSDNQTIINEKEEFYTNLNNDNFTISLNNTSNLENNITMEDSIRVGQFGYYNNIRNRPNWNKVTNKSTVTTFQFESIKQSKLPLQPACGLTKVTRDKIMGGSPPLLGDWPWMVALGYWDERKPHIPIQWMCGGTLISDRFVVTAAHCTGNVGGRKLTIARLGELNLDPFIDDGASPQDISVIKIIPHESYNSKQITNDIALLKLERSVQFNANIQPICLPMDTKMRSKTFVKYSPTVIGYGATSFRGPTSTALLEVVVPVLDNLECKRAFKNSPATIDEKIVCAGHLNGGKDSCQGDSGGPLMIPNGKQFYLIGVVSFGYKCGEPGYPGVYTRVTQFVDWISNTINKN